MGFGGRKRHGVFFLLINFSGSSGSNMRSNRSVRPILMGFGGRKRDGVFFLLINFSGSSGVKYGVK